MNKKFIDISWPISPVMTSYKDSKPVTFTQHKKFELDHVRDSSISLNTHTGTHIDAPSHFLQNGTTIDHMPLTQLIGPCHVLDLSHVTNNITAEDIRPYVPVITKKIILLKTKNSNLPPTAAFDHSFAYLDKTAAELLAQLSLDAVGIDYLGIERAQPNHETHTLLFEANIAVIEGLRLEHIAAGDYFLCCLPLALQNCEAAPARAILFEKEMENE